MKQEDYDRWIYSPEDGYEGPCPDDHEWRLETEGPEVFVAVCSRCGKRTMDSDVLLKLLDDFSY